jgi:crotonobetainyl-CoA:carnitine CoA-transferase CaiB-like acyl-CoA transferase
VADRSAPSNHGGILEGIRVLDFTRIMAGPWCAMLLGDFGADVVKVESLDGDLSRSWGRARFGPNGDMSALYVSTNRNKRALAIDLRDERAREVIARLVKQSDVVIHSYRNDTAEAIGIGYDDVKALNPSAIYCAVTGFGRSGPLRNSPGQDQLMQAYAGLSSITGERDRPAVRIGPSTVDMLTGTQAALGIVLALYDRAVRGSSEGQIVDSSIYDSALGFMSMWIAEYSGTGVVPGKLGPYHPAYPPCGNFLAGDGREFHLAAIGDVKFRLLCDEMLGLPELPDDPRFTTTSNRAQHQDELYEFMKPKFLEKAAAEWVEMGQAHGMTATLIYNVAEVVEQPQAKAIDGIISYPGIEGAKTAGLPIRLSRTPASVRIDPPTFGEHGASILRELGYSEDEVGELLRDGAVVTTAGESLVP